jgi:hypothetical protein
MVREHGAGNCRDRSGLHPPVSFSIFTKEIISGLFKDPLSFLEGATNEGLFPLSIFRIFAVLIIPAVLMLMADKFDLMKWPNKFLFLFF